MNEEQLVRKAQTGDKAAFVDLINKYKVQMYRISLTILHSKEESEDAISEAITLAYEKISTIKNPKAFKAWVMRIVVNESYKIIRHRKKIVELNEWNNQKELEPLTTDIEIEEIIKKLPDDLRIVIVLYYIEQWSIKEISELINIAEGTVKTRLHRARKKLVPLLGNEGERVSLNNE